MGDGSIFYAIGAIIDGVGRKIGSGWYQLRRLFFSRETKRLQVLAGIRKGDKQ